MLRRLIACWLVGTCALLPAAAQPDIDRPPDALLERPDLQAVVDLQVQRDGRALAAKLDADDAALRARAAFALASVQDTVAIPALVDRLRDSVPEVRAVAAFALGQMPEGVPSEDLLQALRQERDATVRGRLIEALGKTGEAASFEQLLALGLPARSDADVALALARYGVREVHDTTAVDWLVERLTASDPTVRKYAAYYFGRVSDPAPWADRVEGVRRALDGYAPSDPAAMHLVRGLGRLAAPVDIRRLRDWVRNASDARTRVNAARALSAYADSAAARSALLDRLGDPSPHVALTAAEVLAGASWTPPETEAVVDWIRAHPARWRVVAPLLRGLAKNGQPAFALDVVARWRDEQGPVVFAAAVPALAPLDTARAWTLLAEAARHEDPRVAYAALTALGDRWARVRDATGRAEAYAEAYYDLFAQGVRRADVATVNAAAPALADARFAPYGAVDVLAGVYRMLLVPDDIEAMTTLLRALGQTGRSETRSEAEPVLREAVEHPHPVIRQTAAAALEALTGEAVAVSSGGPPPVEAPIDWAALRALGPRPRLALQTEKGRIVLALYAEQAPQTVQTVCGFAAEGRYDGVPFHRVVSNFVIQGGDFARADGWGGPGFSIRSEFTRIPYARGTLGMASAGKDTEGSQYFITHSMQPHLDGSYTAFGRVEEGQEVVDRILANDEVVQATVIPTGDAN